MKKGNEIILFENQGVKLEVNLKDETVWLNSEQMAQLFGRDYKTIRKHINNALKEELKNEVVVAKFENTTEHGAIQGKTQTHMVEYYNLDMIISVGYRVKSNNGVIFRKWANKILKEYLIKGYAVNQRRLEYLEKTIKLIDIANRIDEKLEGNDAKEILKVIGDYSRALDLLDDYDHKTLKKIDGNIDERKIEYKECIEVINKLRFNEESSLFAVERDKGLEKNGKAQNGVAYMAIRTGVPVIPVGIQGEMKPFRKVKLNIGEPLDFSQYKSNKPEKEILDKVSKEIMDNIIMLTNENI